MPEKPYDHSHIELKWFERWQDADFYKAEENSTKPKFYVLEMLPYPSGTLHIGHIRNYSIGDALARYKWMRGFNVLHPMGWDAFGLPAENAAIANKRPPREWTLQNIEAMKRTHRRFAFSYDWDREVATCDPAYYRWNQWFFLKMLERGLAYRKRALLNWCPKCATVLANEQVVEGCCWRHEDTPVEQRALDQWFLKITAYADQLLDDMAQLEGGWPERVLTMQRNWIGRSEGAEIDFKLEKTGEPIRVFTTRVDTIYGATCVILAPEHPLNEKLLDADGRAQAKAMVDARANSGPGDIEKEGFFSGHYAVNPYNGERVANLDRQLRADGLRHGRDHGGARARRARFRILPQVWNCDAPRDPASGWRAWRGAWIDPALHGLRHRRELGRMVRANIGRGTQKDGCLRRAARLRKIGDYLPN